MTLHRPNTPCAALRLLMTGESRFWLGGLLGWLRSGSGRVASNAFYLATDGGDTAAIPTRNAVRRALAVAT